MIGAWSPTAKMTKPIVAARLYAGATEAIADDDAREQTQRVRLESLLEDVIAGVV